MPAVTIQGEREFISRIHAVRDAIPTLPNVMGDYCRRKIQEAIRSRYGVKDGARMWANAVFYRVVGFLSFIIGGDKSIFRGVAAQEFGATIRPFQSKFVNRKTGEMYLFIPRVASFYAADWRRGTFGQEYILAKKATIKPKRIIGTTLQETLASAEFPDYVGRWITSRVGRA